MKHNSDVDILSVNTTTQTTQTTQTGRHRLRVGRWTIHSQALDGQQLQSSDWILPRLQPSLRGQRSPKARVLNAHILENPGARPSDIQARTRGTPGTLGKPSFAELWLSHIAGSGDTDSQDSKFIQLSGHKEMLVHSIQVIYNGSWIWTVTTRLMMAHITPNICCTNY